jgi:hypothetical protein
MLQFRKVELSDKEKANRFLKMKNYFLCAYCFTDIYIWSTAYGTSLAFDDDFMYVKTLGAEGSFFTAPLGNGDYAKAIENLAEVAHEEGNPLRIYCVPPEIKEKLEELFPGRFTFSEGRDQADYIYSAESLMYLKGKKLHGKRNHINKFLSEYEGRWSYEELTSDKIHEFFNFQLDWCSDNPTEFLGETCAVSTALKNMDELGIKGGLLRLDGKLIGVTLGSESFDDTFIVHIEKADADVPGAYQMINQQFAQHNYEKYRYIDREEDLGLEGLRKAKLSYYPESITENYYAEENWNG